jgi:prepilin peptidase CpaA
LPRLSDAIVVAAVAAGGGAGALIDLRTRRVPNQLTLSIAALGLTLAAARVTGIGLAGSLAGLAVGALLMLPGHFIGATGAGDVKLFAAIGTLLGPAHIAAAFVYTALAGGLLAVVVAVRRRRLQETMERTAAFVRTGGSNVGEIEHGAANNRFAYAPAIALGALAAVLLGL